jgi:hypothetical protein
MTNTRTRLVSLAERAFEGERLEDELDFISTLDDESVEQYLEYVLIRGFS